jgi:hypothetical protein
MRPSAHGVVMEDDEHASGKFPTPLMLLVLGLPLMVRA